MTLGFRTKIKGKQIHFAEKIIRSLDIPEHERMTNYDLLSEVQKENEQLNIHEFQELKPKLHTIREDKKNRWKVGSDIHFVINNRTKNRFQFAPVLKVKCIQKISIHNDYGLSKGIYRWVNIDGRQLPKEEIETLARFDGFENVEDFWDWFKDDFQGKIIHWTSFTY